MQFRLRPRLPLMVMALAALSLTLAAPAGASAPTQQGEQQAVASPSSSLSPEQRRNLQQMAQDTWNFYAADVDANTGLPRDNIGFNGAPAQGNYTSPTNIGVYLWSIVAAEDMHLINRHDARALISKTISTVEGLRKWNGFLLSWYNTTNGHCITNPGPGGTDCETGSIDGQLISTVDNGWYGAGLVVTRQYLMQDNSREDRDLVQRVSTLLNAMNYGVFYDSGNQCTDITAGQMYGGYIVGQGPAGFHYGMLNAETRIAAYMGIGTHTMPGDVWWRTWRTLPSTNPPHPPTGCAIDTANFDWQGQYPPQGYYTTYNDPQSGNPFIVFEGHYHYNNVEFVPSWGGSMFEALMPNLVVPETTWGTRSFGANDVNYTQMQIDWATQGLGYPVWGLSPSSTPDDTGNYDAFGAVGPPYPNGLASNANCCPYSQYAVTPHASFMALQTQPQEAYANIMTLRTLYPDLYGPYGFFDAVAPRDATYNMNGQTYTVHAGQVGHRYLVLDESMIMAALDNVLEGGAMQSHFAADSVGQAAQPYLQMEQFSITPINR